MLKVWYTNSDMFRRGGEIIVLSWLLRGFKRLRRTILSSDIYDSRAGDVGGRRTTVPEHSTDYDPLNDEHEHTNTDGHWHGVN